MKAARWPAKAVGRRRRASQTAPTAEASCERTDVVRGIFWYAIGLSPAARPLLVLLDFVGVVLPLGGMVHLHAVDVGEKFILARAQLLDEFFRRSLVAEQMRHRLDLRRPLHVERRHRRLIYRSSDGDNAVALDHDRRGVVKRAGELGAFSFV